MQGRFDKDLDTVTNSWALNEFRNTQRSLAIILSHTHLVHPGVVPHITRRLGELRRGSAARHRRLGHLRAEGDVLKPGDEFAVDVQARYGKIYPINL